MQVLQEQKPAAYLAIKENQGIERLPLGGRRHIPIYRQMG